MGGKARAEEIGERGGGSGGGRVAMVDLQCVVDVSDEDNDE